MAIDLLSLKPHQVSRDLSGYITYIYGEAKTGKTTFASQMPQPLLLAFEKGYNALPGIIVQDVTSWGEMKQVVRELKKDAVKEQFKSVIVDTIDVAGALCEKYVCGQLGIQEIGDAGWGAGWRMLRKEFDETFRVIAQLGYAVVFIGHDKLGEVTREDGTKYNKYQPSAATSVNNTAKNMADIYAFAKKYEVNGTAMVKLIFRSMDNSADTGCRFKYIVPEIPDFSYKNVVEALNRAIDDEMKANGNKDLFTDKREVYAMATQYSLDVEAKRFQDLISPLMTKDKEYFSPRITSIVDKYLGTGKKVSQATPDQAEMIYLINCEIEEELVPKLNQ